MELHLQVAQAVQVLNHDLNTCNRVAANQWLVQFQQSDASWEVATGILTSNSSYLHNDFEVELFAAQVLKRKIQSEGVNLQVEARSALQAALLLSAKKFSTGPAQLLTQICLALSALVLRALELKKPIEQLFASLPELQGQGSGGNAILELLTVLPEEVIEDQSVNLAVNSARRWQFTQELLSHTGAVLDFLLQHTKDEALEHLQLQERHRKVLRCLLSWVRGGCFSEIPQSSVPTHPLLGFVFNSLQDSHTFDISIEVLTELVSRNEVMPQVLLSKVQLLKDGLLIPALANRNEGVISGLACLMAELGQAAPVLVAKASPETFALTDALLRCVAYPSQDWEIADSTLNFWCTLAECVLSINTQGDNEKHLALTTFVPIYTALLDSLLSRAEVSLVDYNMDELDGASNLSDGLAFFRRNLEELLTDICRLLGPAQFFTKLLSGTWVALEPPIPWQVVEVRLYALQTVAEVVFEDRQTLDLSIIIRVMMAMHKGPSDAMLGLMHLVHKSAAEVAGSYSKLLCPNSNTVLPLLSFLASGLSIPVAASSCASALRRICENVSCVANETTNLEALLWIGEGLHNMRLSLREEEDIVCAIGCVLSTLNGREILDTSLQRLLMPSYEAIETLLKTESEGSLRQHSAAYAASLDCCIRALTRLGAILSHLSTLTSCQAGEAPVINVLNHFWPLLKSLLASHHMENGGLASATCKALSQIIQASGQQFAALLPEVMNSLSRDFLSFQTHECFIRTAAIALEEFGQEDEFGPLFINTLNAFTAAEVISMMNSSYACDQEPDLIEAYMNFTSTFVRLCPREVVAAVGNLIETSFRKATICCTALHRGAALAAMSFMSCVLETGISSAVDSGICITEGSLAAVTLSVCSQCGESAVSGVVYALLGVSAMARLHKVAKILQQLAALCHISEQGSWKATLGWSTLQGWLVNMVQNFPMECLKPGEAELLVSTWSNALEIAASDYLKTSTCDDGRAGQGGFMHGNGGRSLKRILREFADLHRQTPSIFYPMSNPFVQFT
eukprot:c26750_g1_i1 orf=560-3634(-)